MVEAEGRVLGFDSESVIDTACLETIAYEGLRQEIVYETREFSAVCPFSGLPDYGVLRVEYVPSDRIVELKSLKYYVMSFRTVGIYQEHATSRLAVDLWKLLQPQALKIVTIYNTRGGIDTTCAVSLPEQA